MRHEHPMAMTIANDYRALKARQDNAPDWPYTGQPYSASDSAADARWEFWRNNAEWYGRAAVRDARVLCGLGA